MRVFVTGGNGFIGSVVVRALFARRHGVVCLLRAPSDTARISGLPFERAVGDVTDLASIRAAMADCDATIHLAAPGSWDADSTGALAAVIEGGTQNVVDAALALSGHRMVFVSSTAAIGAADEPRLFDETSPFTVTDRALEYAQAKHRAELRVSQAFERGLHVVTVNPAEVYGPNDSALNTAGSLIDFLTATPVLVCSGGTSVVHVADVADGIIAALDHGRPGERYILGGENVTIRQLAELTLRLWGRKARVWNIPNAAVRALSRTAIRMRLPLPFNPHVVPYATRYWFMDNRKARNELGISFRDAEATIAPTLDWLREARLL